MFYTIAQIVGYSVFEKLIITIIKHASELLQGHRAGKIIKMIRNVIVLFVQLPYLENTQSPDQFNFNSCSFKPWLHSVNFEYSLVFFQHVMIYSSFLALEFTYLQFLLYIYIFWINISFQYAH